MSTSLDTITNLLEPTRAAPRSVEKSLVGGTAVFSFDASSLAQLVRLGEDTLGGTKYFQTCRQEGVVEMLADGQATSYSWHGGKRGLLEFCLQNGHLTQKQKGGKKLWLFRNSIFVGRASWNKRFTAGDAAPTTSDLHQVIAQAAESPLLWSPTVQGIIQTTEAYQFKCAQIQTAILDHDDTNSEGDTPSPELVEKAVLVDIYGAGNWIKCIHWDEMPTIVDELSRSKTLTREMGANQKAFETFFADELGRAATSTTTNSALPRRPRVANQQREEDDFSAYQDPTELPAKDVLMDIMQNIPVEMLHDKLKDANGNLDPSAMEELAQKIVDKVGSETVPMGELKYFVDKMTPDQDVQMKSRNGKNKTFKAGGSLQERIDHWKENPL